MTAVVNATPLATLVQDSGTRTTTCTTVRQATAGESLIFGLGMAASTAAVTLSVTDTQSNPWQLDGYVWVAAGHMAALFSVALTANMPSGTVVTAQVLSTDLAPARWDGSILEVSGLGTGSARVEGNAAFSNSGGTGSTATSLTTSGTLTKPDDLVVGALCYGGVPAFTPDSGVVQFGPMVQNVATPTKKLLMLGRQAVDATPQTISGTWNTSNTYSLVMAAYRTPGTTSPVSKFLIPKAGVLVGMPPFLIPKGGVLG